MNLCCAELKGEKISGDISNVYRYNFTKPILDLISFF